MNTVTRVGLIGLGAMGKGMAQSLRRAGHPPHVFDVRTEAAQAFARDGGVACASLPELGAACDVVVSVVVNAAQTESVLFGPGGDGTGCAGAMKPGSVFVMCSTVDPNWSVAMEKRLAELGLLYIDAPISGGAARAASGEMTMMTAGRPEAYARAEPLLHAMAAKVYKLGDSAGAGSKVKIINQLAGGRAHRRCRRSHGAGPARRRGPGRAVRGHHPQRRQQLDVREPHGARAGRRLHAAVGRGHLRERPRHRARHGPRQQVPAAAVQHRAPDVHAGLDRGLCERGRQRGDQDLSGH
jgi:hypothetical protein